MKKSILWIALLTSTVCAQAQNTPPAAVTRAAPSAAKQDLLQRLMSLQQVSLENMARNLAEQPVRQMMGAAEQALPNVAASKRDAAVATIQSEARKYFDEASGLVKERAIKLGQAVLLPMFDEKLSEDELRQLLVALESPAYKKYQTALPELSNAFAEKLIEDLRPLLDPKLKNMEANISNALGLPSRGSEKNAAEPKSTKPAATTK